jgi:hypothetical protein
MHDNVRNMGSIAQRFVANAIDKALSHRHLPYDSPLRSDLEARAELVGDRNPAVRVLDENNRWVTLDDRINELKYDARYSGCFPQDPLRIARTDQAKLKTNFEKIVTGEVIVE